MALASMTGFARTEGAVGSTAFAWELKSVNSKGLEVKLRLPAGFEAQDIPIRQKLSARFARGSLFATLAVRRQGQGAAVRVNETALAEVAAAAQALAARLGAAPATLDGLLAVRGVVEVIEAEADDQSLAAEIGEAAMAALDAAVAALAVMRESEGAALGAVLFQRLDDIVALTREAEANPARAPAAIRARLAETIATLLDNARGLDPDRLHAEALVMAAKVDVREELDRLLAHADAARALLSEGGPVGRKLDFLAQEFNREANTLCSKSNDLALTRTGLALKAVVEQFREQVQNLE